MKIFNFILGIFSLFGAVYCIFWPTDSFLNAGWIVAILLALLGLCTIIAFLFDKKDGVSSDKGAGLGGFVGLMFGCIIFAISILSLFIESVSNLLLVIVLGVFTIWLLIRGITGLVKAVKQKNSESPKGWVLRLILSIAELVIGVLGILGYLFYSQALSSIYIGIMLAVFGICLILSVFSKSNAEV